jgi:hypothetical protein
MTVGAIFEMTPLHPRLAMFLTAGSKTGISSNQFNRTLGFTLRSAWFKSHGIGEVEMPTRSDTRTSAAKANPVALGAR